jgi:drug/metabolite transporter (DMT)-like permease
MGSTTYLVPPLAVLLAWALLGEAPPVLGLPGGLACLAGVAISRSGSLRAANAEAATATAPVRDVAGRRSGTRA